MHKKGFNIQSYHIDLSKEYKGDHGFWEHKNTPELITIKPTLKCVAKCDFCDMRLKDFDDGGAEVFDLEGYKKLFLDLSEMGTKKITISGGEPLAYRYTKELIYYASELGMHVTLNTNGWLLTKRRFGEFIEAGLMGVNLSLDSPFGEVHDKSRFLPGLFERATSRIKEIQEHYKDKYILNIRLIVSKTSQNDIPEMIDLCKELDADVLSLDMIENDYILKKYLLNEDEIKKFNSIEKEKIYKKINSVNFENEQLREDALKQIEGMYDLAFNSIENFANGIFWPDEHIRKKCTIPNTFGIIEGNGQILACNPIEYTRSPIVGNAINESIKDVWNNTSWEKFREEKMDFCRKCPMNMSHMIKFKNRTIEPREIKLIERKRYKRP